MKIRKLLLDKLFSYDYVIISLRTWSGPNFVVQMSECMPFKGEKKPKNMQRFNENPIGGNSNWYKKEAESVIFYFFIYFQSDKY